jgi:hypothetical protein
MAVPVQRGTVHRSAKQRTEAQCSEGQLTATQSSEQSHAQQSKEESKELSKAQIKGHNT